MKIWKLVSGLLSIVFSVLVFFQSAIAGLGNALENNDEVSGTAGLIVSIVLLVVGILSIVIRNSNSKGGNIAIIILCAIAALVGFTSAGSYSDLTMWSGWCTIQLITAVIALFVGRKRKNKKEEEIA